MELLVLRVDDKYIRVFLEKYELVDLNKASVFPILEEAKVLGLAAGRFFEL